jgi:rod shape-determining protein MreC
MSAYAHGYKTRRGLLRPISALATIFLSLALLGLSRADHASLHPLRTVVHAWSAPLVERVAKAIDPVRRPFANLATALSTADEVESLRAENHRLRGLTVRLDELERDNRDLGRLLRVASVPSLEAVATRVMSVSPGLVSQAIVIGIGRTRGIAVGDPVMSNDAVIGRVVQVNDTSASVVRLVDARSRVPVLIGAGQARAVLTGDGKDQPRLDFLAPMANLVDGDTVITSGVGGLFPRGLAIGRVAKVEGVWRVDLPDAPESLRVVAVLRSTTNIPPDLDHAAVRAQSTGAHSERQVAAGQVSGRSLSGPVP